MVVGLVGILAYYMGACGGGQARAAKADAAAKSKSSGDKFDAPNPMQTGAVAGKKITVKFG